MSSFFSYVWPTKASEFNQEMETISKYNTFDLSDIGKDSLIHICAPGRNGKTSIVLDIIDHFKDDSHVTVFCEDNGMIPGSAKYTEHPTFSFNSQMINDLTSNTMLRKLFVFEDTSIVGKDRRNIILNNLQSGNCMDCTSIFTNQYILDLPRNARENVTLAFVNPGCHSEKKSIFNNYGQQCFEDFQHFSETLDSLKSFEFLVLSRDGSVYTYTPNKRY